MLIVTVRFVVKAQHLSAFSARMRQQAQQSLELEVGCHRFDIASNFDDPRNVFLYEIYDNPEAFDAHLASAHFRSINADTQEWIESKTVERWDGPWK